MVTSGGRLDINVLVTPIIPIAVTHTIESVLFDSNRIIVEVGRRPTGLTIRVPIYSITII